MNLKLFFDQIKKSYEFYITRIDEYGMERFHWSFIDELKNSVKEKKKRNFIVVELVLFHYM